MSRSGPLLGAVAAGGAFGAAVTGTPALIVAFAALAIPAWLIVRRARGAVAEAAWSPPTTALVDPPIRAATTARRVTFALARVEAREMARDAWFGAGVGLCVVMVVSFAPEYGNDVPELWHDVVPDLQFLAHPLVGMVVLASHWLATRTERDGVDELVASLPTSAATRRAGAVVAAWLPVATVALFCVAFLISVDLFSPRVGGPVGAVTVVSVLGAIALGAGGAALGNALARVAKSPLVPVVSLVVIGFVAVRLADGDPRAYETRMLFSTMPPLADPAPDLTLGQTWAHAGAMVALSATTAAAALVHRRPS